MTTIFTKIINGEIPANFVWKDAYCVAFADINPQTLGHVLVVPRVEESHFSNISDELAAHLFVVAKRLAYSQEKVFSCERSLISIVGYEVPHVHLHVFPTNSQSEAKPENAIAKPTEAEMATSMEKIRKQLIADGWEEFVAE